ncbi:MAG: response regulator [Bryobacteraceae bacterium]
MPFKVLLVDDHRILRDGIKAILRAEDDFEVVGDTDSGTDAVQLCKILTPDVVVMDIGLQGLNGVEATAEMLRHSPRAKIVILSIHEDEHSVVSAIRSGAKAFVVKKASERDLLDALRAVARGGIYMSPQVSEKLVVRIQRGDMEGMSLPTILEGLSPRERQVLRLVAEGKTSKEVAVMLDLGLQTVRSYRKTMMKKLSVNNVASLTQLAVSSGLGRYGANGEATANGA